ncbi:hypothetical protein D9758_001241 [Tetrapyrgos nigripes]|uniref:Uncharacterized protein n=1 Tax=Tetrapyrgos nigripes TaxID=182062 RepID=A0A8H5GS68_9AGAR|nr:hypothetical protein D9758_001241 [Tetrapyrgos nigripes]
MSIRLLYSSLRSTRPFLPRASIIHRPFTTTWRTQAQDDPNINQVYSRLQNTDMFKKLLASPEALEAINEFRQVLQNQGFDLTTKPSAMQMMKLAWNSEVRAAGLKLQEAFNKAGVDLSNQNVVTEMMDIMKDLPSPKKD